MLEVMIRFKIKKEYYSEYENRLDSFLYDLTNIEADCIDIIEE
jgi:hypothetical protein